MGRWDERVAAWRDPEQCPACSKREAGESRCESCLGVFADSLVRESRALSDALLAVEWGEDGICRACRCGRVGGHAPDCAVDKALVRAGVR